MRIFLDGRGNLVFVLDGIFLEARNNGEFAADTSQGEPEDWYPDCKPKIEFTSSEVRSIIETLIEVLQNK